MKFHLSPAPLLAVLLLAACEEYDCQDYANCPLPGDDAGSARSPLPTAVEQLQPTATGNSGVDETSASAAVGSHEPSSRPNTDEPTSVETTMTSEADPGASESSSHEQSSGDTSVQSTDSEPLAECDDNEYFNDGQCRPATHCDQDEYEVQAPSSTADRVCSTQAQCQPGTFESSAPTSTTDRSCAPCAVGTFASESNQTACQTWTACVGDEFEQAAPTSTSDRTCAPKNACTPGTFVTSAGTDNTDRTCSPCPSETFSSEVNVAQCTPWNSCAQGETESVAPSATSDRVCSACGVGKYESGGECVNLTTCSPSQYETVAPTATSNRQCASTSSCNPGQVQTAPPTASSDRVCAPCAAGTFSATSNATSCQAWTNCQAGTRVNQAGTSTTNRTCTACGNSTFSTSQNAASCQPWRTCSATQYQSSAPSATQDRVCANLTVCGNENQYVSKTPTSTTDRECQACPGDSRNRGQNQLGCYQVTAGDTHSCYVNTGIDDITTGGVVTNVRCWGNSAGNRTNPPAGKFVSISAGPDFTCGILTDNTVRCWGANTNIATNPRPNVQFSRISSGNDSACGIKTDGRAECWGANGDGQATPPNAAHTYDIIDGGIAVCGRRSDTKRVDCWGNSFAGGGAAASSAFPNVEMLDTSSGNFTAALDSVKVNGVRPFYVAGLSINTPLPGDPGYPTNVNFKAIEVGWSFMCGIVDDPGSGNDEFPVCWAVDQDLWGNVGNEPSHRVLQLSAGVQHVCALNEFGRPACWGVDSNNNTAVPGDL